MQRKKMEKGISGGRVEGGKVKKKRKKKVWWFFFFFFERPITTPQAKTRQGPGGREPSHAIQKNTQNVNGGLRSLL